VVLASTDPPEVQLATNRTWHLPYRWVSDPDGSRLAKPLDAWDEDASIFRPVVVVVAPDGTEVFRELSRDFTDRPDDEPILAAVEALGPRPGAGSRTVGPPDIGPRPSKRAFKPASFIPYFRAIKFNTARAERADGRRARPRAAADRAAHGRVFLSAFDEWRAEHPPPTQE
jgi:hypothetical protein